MKTIRKLTVALLVMALMVMLFPMANVLADDGTVVIFHTNDIHGRAEGSDPLDPDDRGTIIGFARYKTIIDEAIAAEAADRVLVFDAGDAAHGTNFATL
ncbi:MAG TPA: bifunctional metallophosphatase/5'-nucleotidase, partial [Clostridia bacterium]|nr:bifunctional metallophosphatase/5'-nucleotidase [Clostridia bacterium]